MSQVKLKKTRSIAVFFGAGVATKETTPNAEPTIPAQVVKRDREDALPQGFNSPKKSPIPVSFERSPLHYKPSPASKSKFAFSTAMPSAKKYKKMTLKPKGNILNYFSSSSATASPIKPCEQPPTPKSNEKWACRVCTFLNEYLMVNSNYLRMSCEACGALKDEPATIDLT